MRKRSILISLACKSLIEERNEAGRKFKIRRDRFYSGLLEFSPMILNSFETIRKLFLESRFCRVAVATLTVPSEIPRIPHRRMKNSGDGKRDEIECSQRILKICITKRREKKRKKRTKKKQKNTKQTRERGELNAGLHIRLRFANRTALCQGGRQTSKSNQPVM